VGTAAQGVTLREAHVEDAAVIFEIGRECFSDAWRRETIEKDMAGAHSRYTVAEREGEILAYACWWTVVDEAQLVNIGVRKSARRQGIAEALVAEGLVAVEARGIASVYLEVRMSNLPAQALYRKFGFTVQAMRKGVYELPREDGYIMAKSIRNSAFQIIQR